MLWVRSKTRSTPGSIIGLLPALMNPAPYACGTELTVADLCLVPQVYNARRLKVPIEKFPKIVGVDQACLALAAFDQARPQNQPDAE